MATAQATLSSLPKTSQSRSAFFYGTLMAPSVLNRVTNRHTTEATTENIPPLQTQPAILPGFRRHRIKHADYPAITPTVSSPKGSSSHQVRGTYVTGLRPSDIRRLDAFEGDEYERRFVRVLLLPPSAGTPDPQPQAVLLASAPEQGGEWATAETYVWIAGADELEDEEWDFDEFVRERLAIWAGDKGDPGFEDAARVEIERHGSGAVDPTRGRSVNGGEFERLVAEGDVEDERNPER